MSKLIDLEGEILHETDKAILFETPVGKAWLPKAAIEISSDETSILISESFAIEKELV